MKVPVFDFHCDTALAMVDNQTDTVASLRKNAFHIDLERASSLEAYAQCFACFTTPYMQDWSKLSPVTVFRKELAAIEQALAENSDLIALARSADEVRKNREKGLMSAILTIEGPAGFDFDVQRLEELYRTGFRITSLGWNEKNPLTGSHKTGGGLTDQGREFVKEAQRLGMLVDVSHISDEGFWNIMDITDAPVIATHSNSRSVWNESRNLTDDMFRAIVQTGGIAGFNMCAEFTGEAPTLDTACDHIFHFLDLDPSGRHIALGGDLDGITNMPAGFTGVQDYPKFAQRLMERGLDEHTLMNIFWNNALGVMELAVCNHQRS